MLKSVYDSKTALSPEEELKKKLLKNKPVEDDAPTTGEIDSEIQENKPAITQEQANQNDLNKSKATSQIIGGNYADDISSSPIKESILNSDQEEQSTGSKIGSGLAAGAGGLMDMTASVINNKEPMNRKERQANTIGMTTKGLKTGSEIGGAFGPGGKLIGAGVGALAGLTTGLIQGAGDQKKLDTKARLERVQYLDDVKDKRRKAQLLSDGKASLAKSKNILNSQMGMLGSNYTS